MCLFALTASGQLIYAPDLQIRFFKVEPTQIKAGQTAKLSWWVTGPADEIQIQIVDDHGDSVGDVFASSLSPNAEITVSPQSSTKYKLQALRHWSAGSCSSDVTLDVVAAREQVTSDTKTAPAAPLKPPVSEGMTGGALTGDKILAFVFGVVFTGVLLLIAYKDRHPTDTARQIYRVVLALDAAGIGAVIPGMISLNQPVIRAGGAISLFVIVYWFNPSGTVTPKRKSAGEG